MPAYDFECNECGHRRDNVIFKISEYDEMTLKNKPCQASKEERIQMVTMREAAEGLPGNTFSVDIPEQCPGIYEHTFAKPAGFFFKDGAPTPKFHHSANQG